MARKLTLRFFLDNCVPDSVGRVLVDAGHDVIYQREAIPADAADPVVALASAQNERILVTINRRDFDKLATRLQVSNKQLRKLAA